MKGGLIDRGRVSGQFVDQIASLCVPDVDVAITAATGNVLTIGGPCATQQILLISVHMPIENLWKIKKNNY